MPARRTRSSGFLSRLSVAVLCLAAVAGVWAWVSSASPPLAVSEAVYRVWSALWEIGNPPGKPLLLGQQEAVPTERTAHMVTERRYPEIAVLLLDDAQVASHFHKSPIQPLDLAVLLDSVRKKGYSYLGFSSPLMWETPCNPLVEETLRRTLQAFPAAALGMRARTASRPEFTPSELVGSALDPSRIEGSIALLPSANAALPRSLTGASFGPWAIDWVEHESLMDTQNRGDSSYPLLVRWHGDIYPTLPLRLLMLAEGIQPGDVHVKVGSHIAWKKTVLPLDSYGRTTLTGAEKARACPLGEVMEAPPTAEAGKERSYLVVGEPVASQVGDAERVSWLAETLSCLASRVSERTEWREKAVEGFVLRRANEGRASMLLALAIALAFLLIAPRCSLRGHLAAEMAILVFGGLLLALVMAQGVWVPVAPWLAAMAVVSILARLLRLGRVRPRRSRSNLR